ncbi:hypothetical protein AGABI1DRAFT_65280 [Agaricus bisporus var. burnettii JB137-S8]|uniref:Uncharacterized protein n=1 Tax=Agaricus bisporus var. burnettii (strain JB137-S8 / ATCC MYA-4627 / FGSC 10392) TaxID=597362 RepID=K5WVN9_AGABU|nr:uncharacterized protein AGABI1DRAFT_65280 [Agaricus bisporus var. burnettii JB137-S8]EKM74853.1 hypothetical protein AGABI1DRAFT_65280 [Agaricus bisporus var. burnettii JB137-S8]
MAGWIDLFSLFVTVGVISGTIYGIVYLVKQVTDGIQSTKERMKQKGYDISGKGVSIKTAKRFDRQDYIDATQRGMMKTMTAASFNRRAESSDGQSSPSTSFSPSMSGSRPSAMPRANSSNSAKSAGR